MLDPRINPYKADIAAAHLRGVVCVPSYVEGVEFFVVAGLAPMRREPDAGAECMNTLRYGDSFTVYENKNGWAWGQAARDDYVGYVDAAALGFVTQQAPTHIICALSALIFPKPSIKAPPCDRLVFLSKVKILGHEGKFAALEGGRFIHAKQIALLAEYKAPDIVTTAERFLGVPYLWGGNSALGVDCSGLVQLAVEAAGQRCPRDSDMQAQSLGKPVAIMQRGHIIFFKGHVGIMRDAHTLLHANAFHGCVAAEPLADVIARGDVPVGMRAL